jgi:NAD(P)-dependent dehydrogenase (short-subunit alcohol dehydrogenase family)
MKYKVFEDKICLVTGAASGIGASLAKKLLENNAKVVIGGDINEENLKKVEKELNESDKKFFPVLFDTTDYDKFKEVIDNIVKDYGRIDFIFNNAGIAISGEAHEIPIEQWKRIIDVDLYGVVYGSFLAYKHMVKQGSGHIVNISSVAGFFPIPLEAPYVVAKYGVMGLSLVLRVEGALKGVKVNVVCPGVIKTPIFDSPKINIDMDKYVELVEKALGEIATPDECAEVILAGVEKDEPVIPVTTPAKWMWWISRISPSDMLEMTISEYSKILPLVKIKQEE